jgi:hypothetical protein
LRQTRKFAAKIRSLLTGIGLWVNVRQMNGALEILKRERDDASEQIRLLRTRIRDLDSAIAVLEGQPAISRGGRPAGDFKASVLKKVRDAGSAGATPKELADSFTREGRQTSDASVSSTLSRLKGESLVSNRNGRWFAASSDSSPDSIESLSEVPAGWDEFDEEVPF